ncbi:MAG: FG-GAP-like repeat-containing protein [Syntrophales bacterium]|nr:FG-GAP-like repeat-containing protein [Syntrophales bacterium]
MKRFVFFFCILGVIFSGLVWAEEAKNQAKRVAVLPFSVHSSEDINYVRDGIWDMLISRLSVGDGIRVSAKQEVKEALEKLEGKEPTAADVYGLGKRLNLDYAVWGSITKIGNSISLDAKLLDVSTYKTTVGVFEQCRGMDDVIPRITDFAQKIQYHVLGITPPVTEAATLPPTGQVRSPDIPLPGTDEGKVIQAKRGTFTSATNLNPDFITDANPLAQKGFWISPQYKKTFKGMDIGDVDGDKKNEVVVIDRNTVMIYQKTETAFVLRNKLSGGFHDQYLAVDVADINGNGIAEIIVTNFTKDSPTSFVMEFRDGKFVKIASDLEWFFRVINTDEGPVLMGQELVVGGHPFSGPIYEVVWENNTYREGKEMFVPRGLSVFGVLVAKVDGDTERVLALDEYDHINIFRKTKTPLSKIQIIGGSDDLIWRSDDVFGGSNNKLDFIRQPADTDGEETDASVYVKGRILSYDTDGDGKREMVVIKNLSPTGRVFKNVRIFTSSEVYDLEWDGLGLAENWKTKKIQGYVADYQIKDIDNDGRDEVVLAVGLGTAMTRSAIVAYDLEAEQAP